MAANPSDEISQLLQRAVELHRQGRLTAAEALYLRVLELDRIQPDALQLAGLIATQLGAARRGADLIRDSLRLNPSQPGAWANLGHAQLALQEFSAALASYDRALESWPKYAPAHNGRGSALMALHRHVEGVESFERALSIDPTMLPALANKAAALLTAQRYRQALEAYSQLILNHGPNAELQVQRAVALCALQHYEAALADADSALGLSPAHPRALGVRAMALLGAGRPAEVIAQFEADGQSAVHNADLLVTWGQALARKGRATDAAQRYERALLLNPRCPEALMGLGTLKTSARHFEQAAALFAKLMQIAPDGDFHRGVCLHAQLQLCDWSDYETAAKRIIEDVTQGKRVDLPFTFLCICDDPALQQRCAMTYHAAYPGRFDVRQAQPTSPSARIRIAYLSADFLEHPMAYLMAGVFEAHDRNRFETWALSLRSDAQSSTQRRLERAFDHFLDVSADSDQEIAELIAAQQIDIVIDLMGYTAEERPGILLRRPAPIQVNYLGFPATMGSTHIDYLIADEFVVPPERASCYSENIVYLRDCFQANDLGRMSAALLAGRTQLGLPDGAFVWAAFNASVKLNPRIFQLWMRLLQAVPDSVLWLIANAETAQDNLRREALACGVDANRLVFARRVSYPEHLARLPHADVALDTWPFNGGATTSDALWCGVPVVSLSGGAFSSRMSGSLLRAAGLSELVADSEIEYERIALRLAADGAALESLRVRLRRARQEGPLFDTLRATRDIERAYVDMHERRMRGESPASFKVAESLACGS